MASVKEEIVAVPYRIILEEEEIRNATDAVLFVGISLVLGIASRHLLRGTRVPYTVALLVLGIALGSIGICALKKTDNLTWSITFSFVIIIIIIDDAWKTSRLDVSDLSDLKGLKKENKESKETEVDRPQIL